MFDYTFPEGVEWWHTQLDQVLATGIDGFKIDGSDPLVWELILPRGHAGIISHRRYADLMYNDFFDRARARRGSEALIMSRPVDSYTVAGVSFYLDFSPHGMFQFFVIIRQKMSCFLAGWVTKILHLLVCNTPCPT